MQLDLIGDDLFLEGQLVARLEPDFCGGDSLRERLETCLEEGALGPDLETAHHNLQDVSDAKGAIELELEAAEGKQHQTDVAILEAMQILFRTLPKAQVERALRLNLKEKEGKGVVKAKGLQAVEAAE